MFSMIVTGEADANVARGTLHQTILVVDDMQDVRLGFRYVLETAEFNVLEAWNARAALELMRSNPVDLALVDLYMPGDMDGVGLIRTMRQRNIVTPIIAISGAPHIAFRSSLQTARYIGADAVLTKPVEGEILVTAIRRLIGGGPALRI